MCTVLWHFSALNFSLEEGDIGIKILILWVITSLVFCGKYEKFRKFHAKWIMFYVSLTWNMNTVHSSRMSDMYLYLQTSTSNREISRIWIIYCEIAFTLDFLHLCFKNYSATLLNLYTTNLNTIFAYLTNRTNSVHKNLEACFLHCVLCFLVDMLFWISTFVPSFENYYRQLLK
jgi:hypothetical protein